MTSVTATEDSAIETRNINWFSIGSYLLIAFIGMLVILSLPENIHNRVFLFAIYLFLDGLLIIGWISIGSDVLRRKIDPMQNNIARISYNIIFYFFIGTVFAKMFVDRNKDDVSIYPQSSFEEGFRTFSLFFIVGSLFAMLIILLGIVSFRGMVIFNKRWSSWETDETNKEMIKWWVALLLVFGYFVEVIMSAFFDKGVFFDWYLPGKPTYFLIVVYLTLLVIPIALIVIFKELFFILPKKLAKED